MKELTNIGQMLCHTSTGIGSIWSCICSINLRERISIHGRKQSLYRSCTSIEAISALWQQKLEHKSNYKLFLACPCSRLFFGSSNLQEGLQGISSFFWTPSGAGGEERQGGKNSGLGSDSILHYILFKWCRKELNAMKLFSKPLACVNLLLSGA